jgi:serine/threonine protein phosphatase 1
MLNHTLKLDLDADRHLIVGDLHGRYDIFMRLLERAKYDPSKDIVYSVGDMIDREEDSVKVVQFFQQPRCYAVNGNHELMALDSDWYETWINNGGAECMIDLNRKGLTHEWLKDQLYDLPWVIEVGEDREENAFRIVHAEVPANWSDVDFVRAYNEALNVNDPFVARTIWGRTLVNAAAANVANMRPAAHGIEFHPERYRKNFCGHTPVNRAIKCGDTWFLDTWRGRCLTLIDAITEERFVEHY